MQRQPSNNGHGCHDQEISHQYRIADQTINGICSITIDDGVSFSFSGIKAIRDDDAYGGYRVSITSEYDTITTPMQMDITTGDAITPNEVLYVFKIFMPFL